MVTESKDRMVNTKTVNTKAKVKNDGVMRLPHERDESPDAQNLLPRASMKQAASDLEHGLVDTDLHGLRGIEKVTAAVRKPDRPKRKSSTDGKADEKVERAAKPQ